MIHNQDLFYSLELKISPEDLAAYHKKHAVRITLDLPNLDGACSTVNQCARYNDTVMVASRSTPSHEDSEFILCRLCRRPFRRVTGSHLYWKHHIETGDYRERYPNAPFFSSEAKRELSKCIITVWERQGKRWSRERVLKGLQAMRSQGLPLHASGVKTRHPALFRATIRIFRVWDAGLRVAGLNPAGIRRRRQWDERKVTAQIRSAKKSGLLRRGSYFRKSNSGLVQASVARFGSWRAAQKAAGFEPVRPAPIRWSREEVLRQLRERDEQGLSLLATEVHSHASALKDAAERLFGKPWGEVVQSLGFDYAGRERWNRPKVIRRIRQIQRRGEPLNAEAVRKSDSALAQAATRHFRNWGAALAAADIDPASIKLRHWSKGDLERILRRLRRTGRLSRRELREIRREGYVQPTSSIPRYWKSLRAAVRQLS